MSVARWTAVLTISACGFDSGGIASSGTPDDGSETSATASTEQTTSTTSDPSSTTAPGESTTASTTVTTDVETTRADDSSTTGGDSSTGDTSDEPTFGPFGEPVEVAELNSPEFDDDPTLRADMREIYFASLRPGGPANENIWVSTRASVDDPWNEPTLVDALNGPGQDGWPELSHDGLLLTFASDGAGTEGGADIYVTTRADFDSPWTPPLHVDELSTPDHEASAVLSFDRLEVFLCAPVGIGNNDIWRADRARPDDPFANLALDMQLSSESRDCGPFLDLGGTRMVFASTRPDPFGAMDLWTAVRDGDDFGPPEPVEGVNGPADDEDPWWAPDGSVLWFASTRNGGDLDLFVAPQLR